MFYFVFVVLKLWLHKFHFLDFVWLEKIKTKDLIIKQTIINEQRKVYKKIFWRKEEWEQKERETVLMLESLINNN